MEEVAKDAERRYKDKQIRKEKAATFKKLANLAYQRGEYEKALTNYDKVLTFTLSKTVLNFYCLRLLLKLKTAVCCI